MFILLFVINSNKIEQDIWQMSHYNNKTANNFNTRYKTLARNKKHCLILQYNKFLNGSLLYITRLISDNSVVC